MTDAVLIAVLGVTISLMSFAVSMATMYFAWLRRGRLAMTKPALVFFGFDSVPSGRAAKIFLRTLLYSTAVRGKVVEGMYAKLMQGHVAQTFSFWGYGETGKLSPGSGLFVAQSGVIANHHFVRSVHEPAYEFGAGAYQIDVFARLTDTSAAVKLAEVKLSLNEEQAEALRNGVGVLFELLPEKEEYAGHVDARHQRALSIPLDTQP